MLLLARRISLRRQSFLLIPFFSAAATFSRAPHSRTLNPKISPFTKPFSSRSPADRQIVDNTPFPHPLSSLRGGCYDLNGGGGSAAAVNPPELPLCPGCGVHMQESHPSLPGFFSRPAPKEEVNLPTATSSIHDPGVSLSLKSGFLGDGFAFEENALAPVGVNEPEFKPLVCARCHSLRHYGRVKNPSAENLLPDFDFERMVAPRIASASGPPSVVVMVVDAADFDGSFPRKIARLVSSSIDLHSSDWKQGKPANVPRVILAVTKIDLLPSSVGPEDLESFARKRARAGGANKITSIHMVSPLRNWGILNLLEEVKYLAGPRGNVWVVGAQNSGKSTLINALGRFAGGEKVCYLTEAPVPGTTLGIVRVEGVLGGQAKLFDTPGILHPYQITMRLTREEQKLVHMSKELKPRTYRIKVGHSIHIGGLLRLDVEELSVETLYLTVWASPLIPLHMGKTLNTEEMVSDHFGRQLQPPIGEGRVKDLGQWGRREFSIGGSSWEVSSVDIAVAGLGWVAAGLKGEAVLGAWTYVGVDIVSRSSLLSMRARFFEESGFTVSKVVSRADSESCKAAKLGRKRIHLPDNPF